MTKISRLFILLFAFTIFSTYDASAQYTSLKLGINNTKFYGKPEKDAAGNALESFESMYSFTGALMTQVPLHDEDSDEEGGVRFEMTYLRDKFKWHYKGASYQIFDTEGGGKIYSTGQKDLNLTISASTVKLPIMIYQKFETGFELAFGLDLGLVIGINGKGSMTYKGKTENGEDVPEYTAELKYDYSTDDITTVELSGKTFRANGENIPFPKVMGAYYETRVKNGNPFNRYNFGLNGDVAYWITDGFGMRIRANYTFVDYTSDKNTFLRQSLNADKTPQLRKSHENLFNSQLTLEVKF